MNKYDVVNLYTDGASRGNPGQSGAGIYIESMSGVPILKKGYYLGETTNNSAEYTALLFGLRLAIQYNIKRINILLDSKLVVSQINGDYKIRNSRLLPLYKQAIEFLHKIPDGYIIKHIPREQNKIADQLANKAIDMKSEV